MALCADLLAFDHPFSSSGHGAHRTAAQHTAAAGFPLACADRLSLHAGAQPAGRLPHPAVSARVSDHHPRRAVRRSQAVSACGLFSIAHFPMFSSSFIGNMERIPFPASDAAKFSVRTRTDRWRLMQPVHQQCACRHAAQAGLCERYAGIAHRSEPGRTRNTDRLAGQPDFL